MGNACIESCLPSVEEEKKRHQAREALEKEYYDEYAVSHNEGDSIFGSSTYILGKAIYDADFF